MIEKTQKSYDYEDDISEITELAGNPLLDEFLRDGVPDIAWGDEQAELRYSCEKITNSFHLRSRLTKKYAWAIPSEYVLDAISKMGKIVEIGAGTGYWANLLAKRGVDIVCYDKSPPGSVANSYKHVDTYYPIQKGDCDKVKLHPDRCLLLVWPPYDTKMAYDCLTNYAGNTIVYIGEGHGGCTGDDSFHEELRANWELTKTINIPSWYGIHDMCFIYRRNANE